MLKFKNTNPIKVTGGFICGIDDTDKQVHVFKGIPYAKPMAGDLRFHEPEDPEAWEGIKECTEFGNSPVQAPLAHDFDDLWTEEFIISNKVYSEDCMHLNIWAPSNGKDCPVVLYFFGGGFCSGGSSCEIYDGTELAKKGVIYITFDHRVGNLSLFAADQFEKENVKGTLSGNGDLWDAIFVLKWIRNNIRAFGGNPDQVTIWGQSSGSGEVLALAASKAAKGLFSQVISMGFNPFTPFTRPLLGKEENLEASRRILQESGMTWEDFKNQDALAFAEGTVLCNPVVDGKIVEKELKEAVSQGDTNDLKILMGTVTGDFILGGLFQNARPQSKEEMLPILKDFFKSDYDKVYDYYDIDSADFRTVMRQINIDRLITSQLYFANERKKVGAQQTYTYYFTHKMPGPHKDLYGAFHSAEVPYFMNHLSDKRKDYWQEEDRELAEYLNEKLVQFVKEGCFHDDNWDLEEGLEYTLVEGKERGTSIFPKELYDIWVRGYENQTHRY